MFLNSSFTYFKRLKTSSILFALLCTMLSHAQDQQTNAIVIYKTGRYKSNDLNHNTDRKYKKYIEKVKDIEKQLEYQLWFNDETSLFRLSQNLMLNQRSLYVILAEGLKETIYYNLQNHQNTRTTTYNSKLFKTSSNALHNKWAISSEFKFILGYKCFKATSRMEFINPITMKKDVYRPIVWFSYELPFPFGPHLLNGLPGIVLEGTYNARSYFYASKIMLDVREPLIIHYEEASEVTEEQYITILVDRFIKRKRNGNN